MNINLLEDLLKVQTTTYSEGKMVDFLHTFLEKADLDHSVDSHGNVYVTKGSAMFYPLVCAHTDTVHADRGPVEIRYGGEPCACSPKGSIITAWQPNGHYPNGYRQMGLGGDDKAGVFVCLELLLRVDVLKAVFFVSEETGCIGAKNSSASFFSDVGYAIEFDSPESDIASFSNDGKQLFDCPSAFCDDLLSVTDKYGVTKWQHHPYTDVAVLRDRFGFSCCNLPPGYFRMHSPREYVDVRVTEKAIAMGCELIALLGCKDYPAEGLWEAKGFGQDITGLKLSA